MPAAKFDFTENHRIEQGVDSNRQFVWKNSLGDAIDLTGYTAKMQLRKTVKSDIVLLELSTANGGIELGGVLGTITLKFKTADTVGFDWRDGVFDLELTSAASDTIRFIEGEFLISPEVTRNV